MRKDREGLTMKDLMMERSIQLFARKGFKETSIQDIVNELDVDHTGTIDFDGETDIYPP